MVADVEQTTIHQPTADHLAAIADPMERLKEAALISAKARNAVGSYKPLRIEGVLDPDADTVPRLVDQRAMAIGILHLVYGRAKQTIAEELNLDRRMIGRALDVGVPTDKERLRPEGLYPFRLNEVSAVASLDRGPKGTALLRALLALRLDWGWTLVDFADGRKRAPRRHRKTKELLNTPGLKFRPQWTREQVRDLMDPHLRAVFHLPDWPEEQARQVLLGIQDRIREQRSIEDTAQAVMVELAVAYMTDEALSNADIMSITGRKSSTVAEWNTGSSNTSKKRKRREEAERKRREAQDAAVA